MTERNYNPRVEIKYNLDGPHRPAPRLLYTRRAFLGAAVAAVIYAADKYYGGPIENGYKSMWNYATKSNVGK